MPEEATTEVTAGPTERSTEKQESVPSKTQYICSVCRKLVVPTEVKTIKGLRYHCPECKRFMKPLNPEEVKQREAKESISVRRFQRKLNCGIKLSGGF